MLKFAQKLHPLVIARLRVDEHYKRTRIVWLGGTNIAIRGNRVDVDWRQNRDTTDAKVALVVELVLAVIVNVGLTPQAAEVLHA